jgi:hypothetical protein
VSLFQIFHLWHFAGHNRSIRVDLESHLPTKAFLSVFHHS